MEKRILFICHRIPAPPNKGDKIRSFNIIKNLAENNNIHLAFLIDNEADIQNLNLLERFAQNIYYDTISPKIKKISSFIRALLSSQPVSVPYFYSKKLQKKIDYVLDTHPIDCVFCYSSPTAEYLYRSRHRNGLLKKIPWVMDLIDVDSHKWRQYAGNTSQPLKWLYRREAELLLQYEIEIVQNFQHTLLVSESEKQLFHQYYSTLKIQAVSNGVDLVHFAPGQGAPPPYSSPSLVFTGAMDYWPNIDGVTWFVESIFPLIQREIPNVQFHIVGSNPASEVIRLGQIEGVHVTGFVNDVRDYLALADICVIPLRIARGIQNKVLEAMAMGKAVVCSPGALEGIAADPGKDVLVSESSADFAHSVVTILKNPNLQEMLGKQARLCMQQKYEWSKTLENLNHLLTGELEKI